MDTNIEQFVPAVAELTSMVETTKKITVDNFADRRQLTVVKEARIMLKKARVQIEKKGKELRDDAIKFQKAVIQRERELIAIIAPEETRLEGIEEQARQLAIIEERKRKLPERLAALKEVSDEDFEKADEEAINRMDDVTFQAFLNGRISARNAKRQAELDAREAKIHEEEQRRQAEEDEKRRQAEIEAGKEKARQEGERRAREEQERKEREERERKERAEAEARIAAARVERTKKYKTWLTANGWTEETRGDFKIEDTPEGFVLYRRLGIFPKV